MRDNEFDKKFEKNMRNSQRFFWVFFIIVFTIMLLAWFGMGVAAYRLIEAGPEGLGHAAGEVYKGFKEGSK